MRRRRAPSRPIAFRLLVGVVPWLVVAAVVVVTSWVLADSAHPPAVVKNEADLAVSHVSDDAFSLKALHDRLPEGAFDQVERYVAYYRDDRRRGFADALARSTRYIGHFKRIFREHGLPEELAYLPLIESGFMETAVSPAQAVGVWQFIEETGRRYDLHRNWWFDGRRDPLTSAKAAARYLKNLYGKFGDWDLALAAYNAGAGTVRWAQRTNRKAGEPTSYWALELPDETENYVPAFIAAVLIASNPKAFGFEQIQFMPQLAFEQLKVEPGLSLARLASHLEVDKKTLYELNPELLRGVVPPGEKPYMLRVPEGLLERLPAKFANGRTVTLN